MDNQQNDTPDSSAANATGQVMDVTAPTQHIDVSDASSEATPTNEAPTEATVSGAPDQLSTPEAAPETSTPEPEPTSSSAAEAPEPAATNINITESAPAAATETPAPSSEPSSEASSDTPTPDAPLLQAAPAHAKGGKPIMAIIVAIIVAIALAGLVIFAYLKHNKNDGDIKRTDTTAASSQTVVDKPQASASDVDAANQAIDNNLKKADDSKDFPSNSLTDTSLGL